MPTITPASLKEAQAAFESLAKETDASSAIRGRAEAMATFLKAGGDKEFGTVPKPVPALAAQGNPKGPTSP